MTDTFVVNASPIISLAKIGCLNLLPSADNLVVPQAVAEEILAGPSTDPGHLAIAAGFGGAPRQVVVPTAISEWGLGRGESAVLALALEIGGTAVVDDRDARRAAVALGIRVLGTPRHRAARPGRWQDSPSGALAARAAPQRIPAQRDAYSHDARGSLRRALGALSLT